MVLDVFVGDADAKWSGAATLPLPVEYAINLSRAPCIAH